MRKHRTKIKEYLQKKLAYNLQMFQGLGNQRKTTVQDWSKLNTMEINCNVWF